MVDLRKMFLIIAMAKINLLLFAFISVLLVHLLNAIRWKMCMMEASNKITLYQLILVYWKSMFIGLVMPTEYGGDILRVKTLWNKIDDNDLALASVLWSRVSGFLSMITLIVLVVFFSPNRYIFSHQIIFLIIFSSLIIISLFFIVKVFFKLLGKYNKYQLSFLFTQKISIKLKTMLDIFWKMATCKTYAWKIFTLALIAQIMMVINNYFYALSLGQNINIIDMFFFIPMLGLVSLLPITIGGIGLKEGAFIFFFSTIGITTENALAIALLNRAVLIVLSLTGGLLFLKPTKRFTEIVDD